MAQVFEQGGIKVTLAEGVQAPENTPFIFADVIANVAHSPHVVKFYLLRTDPNVSSTSEYRNNFVAQIGMPLPAFVNAFALFEHSIKNLVDTGVVTQQAIDAACTAFSMTNSGRRPRVRDPDFDRASISRLPCWSSRSGFCL